MAQITVTGHLFDASGTAQVGAPVTFELTNLNGNLPYVSGTNIIVTTKVSVTTTAGGAFTAQIQGNDTITPSGTFYKVTFNTNQVSYYLFIGAGPYDLDSTAPLTTLPIPIGPPPTQILSGNNTFTGSEIFNGTVTLNGEGSSGNVAIKPPVVDCTQYVSANIGNDANDGVSPGTAKLTIAAAITALNASNTGGGTVYVASGIYAGGITMQSGVRVFGQGIGATRIVAPNGGVGVDFPAGTTGAQLENLWIDVNNATSTGITMEGNIGLGKFTQFNTIRNIRITGNGITGTHGFNSVGTNAIGDVSLNRFDTIITEQVDIPFICKWAEGNTWSDIQVATWNYSGNIIAFDATGAYDQFVQLRVTNESTGTGGVAYFGDGWRNQVQVYAESDNVNIVAVEDNGIQNMYLVTVGKDTVPGTSLTGQSGIFTNTATIPFYFLFPSGFSSGSPVLELADSGGTVRAFFDNNGALKTPNGSASAPAICPMSDTDDGIWFTGASLVSIAAGGVDSFTVASTGAQIGSALIYGWTSSGGSTNTSPDTGISRKSAGIIGLGNGSAGDISGGAHAAFLRLSESSAIIDLNFNGNGIKMGSNVPLVWYSTATGVTADTGLSRISAGLIGIGNGTQGDFSGAIKCTSPIINGTPSGTGIPTLTLKKGSGGGNYTHSGDTNYTDVDATNLSYTVTIPTGWKLAVQVSLAMAQATAAAGFGISLFDSATLVEQVLVPFTFGSTATLSVALSWVIVGDGASHTVKLQYKTLNTSDAVEILNSSATLLPTMVFILSPSN